MTVLTATLASALTAGMVTFGAAPNPPVTDTEAFALDEEDEEDEDDAFGDDDPQPASTRMPSTGTVRAAAMRRMGNLGVGSRSGGQPTGCRKCRITVGQVGPRLASGQFQATLRLARSVQATEQVLVPDQDGVRADAVDAGGLAEGGTHVKGQRVGHTGLAGRKDHEVRRVLLRVIPGRIR